MPRRFWVGLALLAIAVAVDFANSVAMYSEIVCSGCAAGSMRGMHQISDSALLAFPVGVIGVALLISLIPSWPRRVTVTGWAIVGYMIVAGVLSAYAAASAESGSITVLTMLGGLLELPFLLATTVVGGTLLGPLLVVSAVVLILAGIVAVVLGRLHAARLHLE